MHKRRYFTKDYRFTFQHIFHHKSPFQTEFDQSSNIIFIPARSLSNFPVVCPDFIEIFFEPIVLIFGCLVWMSHKLRHCFQAKCSNYKANQKAVCLSLYSMAIRETSKAFPVTVGLFHPWPGSFVPKLHQHWHLGPPRTISTCFEQRREILRINPGFEIWDDITVDKRVYQVFSSISSSGPSKKLETGSLAKLSSAILDPFCTCDTISIYNWRCLCADRHIWKDVLSRSAFSGLVFRMKSRSRSHLIENENTRFILPLPHKKGSMIDLHLRFFCVARDLIMRPNLLGGRMVCYRIYPASHKLLILL